jgi:hypothetical protein
MTGVVVVVLSVCVPEQAVPIEGALQTYVTLPLAILGPVVGENSAALTVMLPAPALWVLRISNWIFTEGLVKLPNVVPLSVRLTLAGVVMLTAGDSTTLNVWVCAHATGAPSAIRKIGARILSSLGIFRVGNAAGMQH